LSIPIVFIHYKKPPFQISEKILKKSLTIQPLLNKMTPINELKNNLK
jgi:hypothetical protein